MDTYIYTCVGYPDAEKNKGRPGCGHKFTSTGPPTAGCPKCGCLYLERGKKQ